MLSETNKDIFLSDNFANKAEETGQSPKIKYDLLKTVDYGGCSSKISAKVLENVLSDINKKNVLKNPSLLIGAETHDDAAVYKINEEQAIIFTTDFFPPVCSDPYTFGQIAAANALSDVYAMGGQVLMALNLIMFPSKPALNKQKEERENIPIEVLAEILKGGQDKVFEAGALIVGGHTIDDFPPKYGLAVVGLIHPKKVITNASAKAGDVIILTKPLGIGTIIIGKRLDLVSEENYQNALEMMKQLNKETSAIMNKYEIKCATDITGFGLLGHLKKMAKASDVCIEIDLDKVPFLEGALDLIELGCIPGAAFKNQEFVENQNSDIRIKNLNVNASTYSKTMLLYDPQTSGGMAICVPEDRVKDLCKELKIYYPKTTIIGKVEKR